MTSRKIIGYIFVVIAIILTLTIVGLLPKLIGTIFGIFKILICKFLFQNKNFDYSCWICQKFIVEAKQKGQRASPLTPVYDNFTLHKLAGFVRDLT